MRYLLISLITKILDIYKFEPKKKNIAEFVATSIDEDTDTEEEIILVLTSANNSDGIMLAWKSRKSSSRIY